MAQESSSNLAGKMGNDSWPFQVISGTAADQTNERRQIEIGKKISEKHGEKKIN